MGVVCRPYIFLRSTLYGEDSSPGQEDLYL
jgi:hypothetical protein